MRSMSNPIDDLLSGMDKEAGQESTFFRQTIDAAKGGLGLGLASATMTGVAMGAQHLYQAATKSRDFRTMLEHNQDLATHENPEAVSMAFTSLRKFAPEFSKDPLVAGTYVRRIAENPNGAGGVIGEALGHNRGLHPMMEQGLMGMQSGLKYKDPKELVRKDMEYQKELEGFKSENQRSLQNNQFSNSLKMEELKAQAARMRSAHDRYHSNESTFHPHVGEHQNPHTKNTSAF